MIAVTRDSDESATCAYREYALCDTRSQRHGTFDFSRNRDRSSEIINENALSGRLLITDDSTRKQ